MRLAIDQSGTLPLDPNVIYPLPVFFRVSRLGESTVSKAAREYGIELRTRRVGRVKFVEGADACDFVRALAEAQCKGST